jgi:hypothetical protein
MADESECKRFGYIHLHENTMVKVEPKTISHSYGSSYGGGFLSDDYTIIESYDFYTKTKI